MILIKIEILIGVIKIDILSESGFDTQSTNKQKILRINQPIDFWILFEKNQNRDPYQSN